MAKTYYKTGALEGLLSQFEVQGITDFKSLNHILVFRNNFDKYIEQIKQKYQDFLISDINLLESKKVNLSNYIISKLNIKREIFFNKMTAIELRLLNLEQEWGTGSMLLNKFLHKIYSLQKLTLERKFEKEKDELFKRLKYNLKLLNEQIIDKKTNSEKWVTKYSEEDLYKAEQTLHILESNEQLLYGAVGEERAFEELKKLPDSYVVINNLTQDFSYPIHDKRNGDKIYSIQIDHIVIGPTGLFIIETKNWGQSSKNNTNLFSPSKQVQRHSFALFVLLNQAIENGHLESFRIGYSNQKISPKNIVLWMSNKPEEDYQYVKFVNTNEINDYITSGNIIYNHEQIRELEEYIVDG